MIDFDFYADQNALALISHLGTFLFLQNRGVFIPGLQ